MSVALPTLPYPVAHSVARRLADDSATEAERPQHHELSGMNQIPLQHPQGSEALRLWTAALDEKESG